VAAIGMIQPAMLNPTNPEGLPWSRRFARKHIHRSSGIVGQETYVSGGDIGASFGVSQ